MSCPDCARLRRLLNLKDDAFSLLYEKALAGMFPPAQVRVIELGFGLEEIEEAKARGENPYFKGTELSDLHEKCACLSAELAHECAENARLVAELRAVQADLAAARKELAEHPIHEACPKCRQKMDSLRKRAEKAEKELAELREAVLPVLQAFASDNPRWSVKGWKGGVVQDPHGVHALLERLAGESAAEAAKAAEAEKGGGQ